MARRESERNPGPGDYNCQVKGSKSVSSCFASTSDRFGTGKGIKAVKHPGPGSYNVKGSQNTQKLSFNKSNEGYFNSKTARFQKDIIDESVGPAEYFNSKQKAKSVSQFRRTANKEEHEGAHKTVQRGTLFEASNKNPGPGEYRANNGMSYQLQKMLLRKQTTNVLPK